MFKAWRCAISRVFFRGIVVSPRIDLDTILSASLFSVKPDVDAFVGILCVGISRGILPLGHQIKGVVEHSRKDFLLKNTMI